MAVFWAELARANAVRANLAAKEGNLTASMIRELEELRVNQATAEKMYSAALSKLRVRITDLEKAQTDLEDFVRLVLGVGK